MSTGNTLLDVKNTAKSLVGDPLGDFADDDYVIAFIKIAYTNAINYLKNTCSPFMTEERVLPGVPAGTTTLSPFQVKPQNPAAVSGQAGAMLSGLMNPLRLMWKQVGQPESNYVDAWETKDLPFITPTNYIVGQRVWWEWRQYKLFITPLQVDTDWFVKGEFIPQLPLEDDAEIPLHPNIGVALGFMTATLIGGSRVNATYTATWGQAANMTLDDISADLVRKEQSTSQRIGRYTGRKRRYWR